MPSEKHGRIGSLLVGSNAASAGTISKDPVVDPPVAPPKGDEIGSDVRCEIWSSILVYPAVLGLRRVSSLRARGMVSRTS